MMLIWVLDSNSEVNRYLDIIYTRLCGLRLLQNLSKVFYVGSIDENIVKYVSGLLGDPASNKIDELDIKKVLDESKEGDILFITTIEELGSLLGDYTNYLDIVTPAVLLLSFEDGHLLLKGVLSMDIFKFIEI